MTNMFGKYNFVKRILLVALGLQCLFILTRIVNDLSSSTVCRTSKDGSSSINLGDKSAVKGREAKDPLRSLALPNFHKPGAFNAPTLVHHRKSRPPNYIPHIIHQTWDDENIPSVAQPWIESCRKHHPTWEYWFWTQRDFQQLIKCSFPKEYTKLYYTYPSIAHRADILRYFVLYTFGGWYLDLDIECLKPLDSIMKLGEEDHDLILSWEAYEHTYVAYERRSSNVMTTIMASRPHHPFLGEVIDALPEFAKRYNLRVPSNILHTTGPFFLQAVYEKYIANSSAEDREKTLSSITVLHPKYFLPTFDNSLMPLLQNKCVTAYANSRLHPVGQWTCVELRDRKFVNKPHQDSVTDHKWIHFNLYTNEMKVAKTMPIRRIVKGGKNITELMDSVRCKSDKNEENRKKTVDSST